MVGYIILGFLFGAIAMVAVDYYLLGWREERAQRFEAKARLSAKEVSLAAARKRLTVITNALGRVNESAQALASENEILNDNLNRMSVRLDQLDEQLETAEFEKDNLQDTLQMLSPDKAPEPIPFDDVELARLRQELAEARAKAEQASQWELENAELRQQLAEADKRVQQLKAQVISALRQAQQTKTLRTRLVQAKAVIDEAEAEVAVLRERLAQQEILAAQAELARETALTEIATLSEQLALAEQAASVERMLAESMPEPDVSAAADIAEDVDEDEFRVANMAIISEPERDEPDAPVAMSANDGEGVFDDGDDGGKTAVLTAVVATPPVATSSVPSLDMSTNMAAQNRNLTQIKGIGPTYSKRLKAAGVVTFNDLVKTPPHVLAQVVKLRDWQAHLPVGWIAEAQALIDADKAD